MIAMKKVWVLLLLSIVLVSFFSFAVFAADTPVKDKVDLSGKYFDSAGKQGSYLCSGLGWNQGSWFCSRMAQWEPGVDWKNGDLGAIAIFLKYIFLVLSILLVYSALAYGKFPESAGLRIAIAIVVGFLITFMISTSEVLTAMTSYSALGITLIIFFPILILGFFTLVVASKASPMGIFLQKIMWVIYSFYLFIKAGAMLLLKYSMSSAGDVVSKAYTVGTDGAIAYGTTIIDKAGTITDKTFTGNQILVYDKSNEAVSSIIQFFAGKDPATLNSFTQADNTILTILLIAAIAVFIIMVASNKAVSAWVTKEKIDSEIEARRATTRRSDERDKLNAESMER